MNPLKSPFWEYFEHLAAAFAEDSNAVEVLSLAASLQGDKARDSLLCMDYTCQINLSPSQKDVTKTIVLEQGYHYFLTQIEAYEIAGTNSIPTFVSIRDDANEVDLSGGPLVEGQPSLDRPLIELHAFSQASNQTILQSPNHFFTF